MNYKELLIFSALFIAVLVTIQWYKSNDKDTPDTSRETKSSITRKDSHTPIPDKSTWNIIPQDITDETFTREVLESDVPVLVDFWAPWCGSCRMVAPVVDQIANQYKYKVKVVKLNTDENPNVASQYGIRSIPTLMVFKSGQKVDMIVGAVPSSRISTMLDEHLE